MFRFVCTTRNIRPSLHNVLLRSYTTWSPTEENYVCHIWEAARATSAAPLFFEPLTLRSSGATFGDGALGLNNPIFEVLHEADILWPNTTIRSVLSIGTGLTDVKGLDTSQHKMWDVLKTCVDLSMNANKQAENFAKTKIGREMFGNRTYFRFDVDRNIETISLEEWEKLDEIDGLTEAYLGRPDKEKDLLDCARSLCNRIASGC
jgi:patatin-like phospholipase/acyl hydrolase